MLWQATVRSDRWPALTHIIPSTEVQARSTPTIISHPLALVHQPRRHSPLGLEVLATALAWHLHLRLSRAPRFTMVLAMVGGYLYLLEDIHTRPTVAVPTHPSSIVQQVATQHLHSHRTAVSLQVPPVRSSHTGDANQRQNLSTGEGRGIRAPTLATLKDQQLVV